MSPFPPPRPHNAWACSSHSETPADPRNEGEMSDVPFSASYACEAAEDDNWRNMISRTGWIHWTAESIRPALPWWDWEDLPVTQGRAEGDVP
jgi:hypothetical protein